MFDEKVTEKLKSIMMAPETVGDMMECVVTMVEIGAPPEAIRPWLGQYAVTFAMRSWLFGPDYLPFLEIVVRLSVSTVNATLV